MFEKKAHRIIGSKTNASIWYLILCMNIKQRYFLFVVWPSDGRHPLRLNGVHCHEPPSHSSERPFPEGRWLQGRFSIGWLDKKRINEIPNRVSTISHSFSDFFFLKVTKVTSNIFAQISQSSSSVIKCGVIKVNFAITKQKFVANSRSSVYGKVKIT